MLFALRTCNSICRNMLLIGNLFDKLKSFTSLAIKTVPLSRRE